MKKVKYLMIILFISPLIGFSQNTDSIETEDEVYTIVEQMPEMLGGKDALQNYLRENVRYPEKAKSKRIQGKVYINFTVSRDGVVRDIKVLRGVHRLLDNEALRVIKKMPVWKPGVQRGKTVSVSYNLPINFVLKKKGKGKRNKN